MQELLSWTFQANQDALLIACADALIVSSVLDVTGARRPVCFHGHTGIS